jgi:hypothetical protein
MIQDMIRYNKEEIRHIRIIESSIVDKIKNLCYNQIYNHPCSPVYSAVAYYGRSFTGDILHGEELRKRWDLGEVRKTHKFIKNLIKNHFGSNVSVWFFTERHKDTEKEDGTIKKGAYHSNILIGGIDDYTIENPNPYLTKLFYEPDELNIPVSCRNIQDIESLKLVLLNICIRQAKWVGQHPNALNLQYSPKQSSTDTFYFLKDFTTLDDMLTIIDFENSDFDYEDIQELLERKTK